MTAERRAELAAALAGLGADLASALEDVGVPSYLLDAHGRIIWTNDGYRRLFGDVEGRLAWDVIAPESRQLAEEAFARKMLVGGTTEFEISVLDPSGRRVPVEISSVPLLNGHTFVGTFGLVTPPGTLSPKPLPAWEPRLTPRQHDVLRLLGHGLSTAQIATELGISPETVRNHVRAVLRALRQQSRVAAVAEARRHGLI